MTGPRTLGSSDGITTLEAPGSSTVNLGIVTTADESMATGTLVDGTLESGRARAATASPAAPRTTGDPTAAITALIVPGVSSLCYHM